MSVLRAARTLGRESDWSLSNLEMQKVLYIAQMLHLGRTGKPLFTNRFEAWDYGPVVPDLYHAVKGFRYEAVQDVFQVPFFEEESIEFLSVCDALTMTRHLSPGQLISYTHRPGGAWEAHRKPNVRGETIPLADIREEWERYMRPSPDAIAWATAMADEVEARPSRYLEAADERAFRARLLGGHLH